MTDPMPQMYNHCVAVYKAMDKTARPMTSEDTADGKAGPSRRVWVGFFTKLINEDLGLAVPYFTSVRNNLIAMGCIAQIARGGGTHPSTWELIREPTEELFNAKGTIRTNSKAAVMEGQIRDLDARLKAVEKLLQNIA